MVLAFFLLGIVLFLTLAVIGYRYRAHQAEARANRAEGALDESRAEKTYLRNLTEKAIRLAAEAAHLDPDKVFKQGARQEFGNINATVPAYTSQIVAYCSTCNVSVRHPPESYPVKCPREGCGTLIDPVLDNPPTL